MGSTSSVKARSKEDPEITLIPAGKTSNTPSPAQTPVSSTTPVGTSQKPNSAQGNTDPNSDKRKKKKKRRKNIRKHNKYESSESNVNKNIRGDPDVLLSKDASIKGGALSPLPQKAIKKKITPVYNAVILKTEVSVDYNQKEANTTTTLDTSKLKANGNVSEERNNNFINYNNLIRPDNNLIRPDSTAHITKQRSPTPQRNPRNSAILSPQPTANNRSPSVLSARMPRSPTFLTKREKAGSGLNPLNNGGSQTDEVEVGWDGNKVQSSRASMLLKWLATSNTSKNKNSNTKNSFELGYDTDDSLLPDIDRAQSEPPLSGRKDSDLQHKFRFSSGRRESTFHNGKSIKKYKQSRQDVPHIQDAKESESFTSVETTAASSLTPRLPPLLSPIGDKNFVSKGLNVLHNKDYSRSRIAIVKPSPRQISVVAAKDDLTDTSDDDKVTNKMVTNKIILNKKQQQADNNSSNKVSSKTEPIQKNKVINKTELVLNKNKKQLHKISYPASPELRNENKTLTNVEANSKLSTGKSNIRQVSPITQQGRSKNNSNVNGKNNGMGKAKQTLTVVKPRIISMSSSDSDSVPSESDSDDISSKRSSSPVSSTDDDDEDEEEEETKRKVLAKTDNADLDSTYVISPIKRQSPKQTPQKNVTLVKAEVHQSDTEDTQNNNKNKTAGISTTRPESSEWILGKDGDEEEDSDSDADDDNKTIETSVGIEEEKNANAKETMHGEKKESQNQETSDSSIPPPIQSNEQGSRPISSSSESLTMKRELSSLDIHKYFTNKQSENLEADSEKDGELARNVATIMVENVRREQTLITSVREAERNKIANKLQRKLRAKKEIEELVRKFQYGNASGAIQEEEHEEETEET